MNNLPFGIVAFYVFILGLCIGSFLNVAILRGLSGEDIVFGRSICPKCQNQLAWYMNIPLVSYIFLRGKCAFCKVHISFQYPLIEFISGLCFLGSFLAFGLTLKFALVCIILSLFIVLSATDFKETVILDYHAYLLAFVAFLYSVFKFSDLTIVQSLLGGIFGFLFFEIFSFASRKLIGFRMFGEGDSLIAIGIGMLFGIKIFLVVAVLSFLIQCAGSIPLLIINSYKQRKIQLSVAYLIVLFSIFLLIILNYIDINNSFYLFFAIFISALLIWALKNILFEIRTKKMILDKNENKENIENPPYCLLPFGPALIFAAFLCLFFLPQIKEFFKIFIS